MLLKGSGGRWEPLNFFGAVRSIDEVAGAYERAIEPSARELRAPIPTA